MLHRTPPALARGDVLVRADRGAIVWRVERDAAVVLPLRPRRLPRHRGDVAIEDLAELLALGCEGGELAVRAGSPFRLRDPQLCLRTGRATTALLGRIGLAMQRLAAVTVTETAGRRCPPAERCVRL